MTHLRLAPRRFAALHVLSLAVAALVATTAQAQVPAPPAQQQSGDVYVVVPPPPGMYPPVQVVEMPGVYGAGYAPQAPNQRIGMLQQELVTVQAQYSQYSIGGPIALTVVGGVTMAISGMFFMVYMLADAFDTTGDSGSGMLVSGLLTLGGVAMLVGGLVWMFSRISERRPYGRRIKEIKQELANYGVRASLDVRPVPSGAVLTGTFAF